MNNGCISVLPLNFLVHTLLYIDCQSVPGNLILFLGCDSHAGQDQHDVHKHTPACELTPTAFKYDASSLSYPSLLVL